MITILQSTELGADQIPALQAPGLTANPGRQGSTEQASLYAVPS